MIEMLSEFNSGVDFPLSAFPDELITAFPDAKFILTKRDPAKWSALALPARSRVWSPHHFWVVSRVYRRIYRHDTPIYIS